MFTGFTTLRMRTKKKAIVEQKNMCHSVSARGKGKPEYAKIHLLNRMTDMLRAGRGSHECRDGA